MPERIKESFVGLFWYPEESFLADYVDEQGQNRFIRPNQIIACLAAVRYAQRRDEARRDRQSASSPVDAQGLRTLSPRNPFTKRALRREISRPATAHTIREPYGPGCWNTM